MQFDVFENPIPKARKAYPFVAVLQSDVADTGRDRIVAPLAPGGRLAGTVGRLTPRVMVGGVEHVLFVHYMATLPTDGLRTPRGRLIAHRDDIVAALDYLFLGV